MTGFHRLAATGRSTALASTGSIPGSLATSRTVLQSGQDCLWQGGRILEIRDEILFKATPTLNDNGTKIRSSRSWFRPRQPGFAMRGLVFALLAVVCGSELAETAIVNTPGDGFLALRSEPSTSTGTRLAQVPHGTRLDLGECVSPSTKGRWCRTQFEGQRGWVFERYLTKAAGEGTQANARRARTPGRGDPVRGAILDAARAQYPKPVTFQVQHLKVLYGWAYACVTPIGYESSCYLLQGRGGSWEVVSGVPLAGEESSVEMAYRDMRNSFREAPNEIFD